MQLRRRGPDQPGRRRAGPAGPGHRWQAQSGRRRCRCCRCCRCMLFNNVYCIL